MKQWISEVIGGGRTDRLWTWWRVAGLALMACSLAALVIAAGCSGHGTTSQASSPPQPPEPAGQPAASPDKAAQEIAVKYAKAEATVETSKGTFKFTFFPKEAPRTVENFVKLADKKFYDGLIWHRYEPGFVIQGGDPNTRKKDQSTWGMGGPGYNIPAEFNSHKHVLGTVAMARSQDPDSAGSQFYITLAPQPGLDGQYTVFGQVTSGIDVVLKLRKGDVMKSIRIEGVQK